MKWREKVSNSDVSKSCQKCILISYPILIGSKVYQSSAREDISRVYDKSREIWKHTEEDQGKEVTQKYKEVRTSGAYL